MGFRTAMQLLTSLLNSAIDPAQKTETLKLSILTQFYPPDFAATGQFIEELSRYLAGQNTEVQVFTGQPNYAFATARAPETERNGKLLIRRSQFLRSGSRKFWGRTLSSLAFCAQAALHLLKREHRGNLMLLVSEPPYLQTVGWLIKMLLGTPYVCLVYDLYPDVAVALGVVSRQSWVTRLWHWVNRQVWQQAEAVIVPCPTMKDRIVARVPAIADKITVIHNWTDPNWIRPLAKTENEFAQTHDLVKPFTVLYSGNMGRCHDMETILQAAWELRAEPVKFVLIGAGPKQAACQQRAADLGLQNCVFLPYQDKQRLPESLTACDLSLVSIEEGMEGLVAPSKLYSALAAGRPVAAICEPHSYLRPLIAQANCGAAFNNGDRKGLASFIRYLSRNPEVAAALGTAGHRYVSDHFTLPQIGEQYRQLFLGVKGVGLEAVPSPSFQRSPEVTVFDPTLCRVGG